MAGKGSRNGPVEDGGRPGWTQGVAARWVVRTRGETTVCGGRRVRGRRAQDSVSNSVAPPKRKRKRKRRPGVGVVTATQGDDLK